MDRYDAENTEAFSLQMQQIQSDAVQVMNA
jgi:hypothetical protein